MAEVAWNPTQEQIARETAAIRAEWSDDEYQKRTADDRLKRKPARFMEVGVQELKGAMSNGVG